MPYIKPQDRTKYNPLIEELVEKLTDYTTNPVDVGHLNYVISSIIWKLFDADKKYKTANDLLNVLNAVNLEFYRRKVAPYEDLKIKENGDIF